jgi:hypothetical protein
MSRGWIISLGVLGMKLSLQPAGYCRCYHFGDTSLGLQTQVADVPLLCDSLAIGKWSRDIRAYSSHLLGRYCMAVIQNYDRTIVCRVVS